MSASTIEPKPTSVPSPRPVPVVGVGASAGGLPAVERLLSGVGSATGAAYVVVMHLDPNHESVLAELLARNTDMPVHLVRDGDPLRPNEVFVIPPNAYLTVDGGELKLAPLSRTHGTRLAVDRLFTSLAQELGPSAVGIILSGTGSDGTVGIRAIKEQGGLVMVQAPSDSEYDGMPRSAIATELVDYVMPVSEMGESLRHHLAKTREHLAFVEDEERSADLEPILEHLRETRGHAFSAYARTVLEGRLRSRMLEHGVSSLGAYAERLAEDAGEEEALFRILTGASSRFFEDSESFRNLGADVLERLAQSKPPSETLRIWVAGCGTGAEAYGIAMLAVQAVRDSGLHRSVQVFATDIDERALAEARRGTFPAEAVDDVPPDLKAAFLQLDGDRYRVTPLLREAVLFARHDVLEDPPFSRLDLVSCRYLLNLLQPSMQRRLLARLHFALTSHGTLFVGRGESVTEGQRLFRATELDPSIARRSEVDRREGLELVVGMGQKRPSPRVPSPAHTARTTAEQGLVQHFSPPAALVDEGGQALYFHGDLEPFLTIPSGTPTANIFERARSGIRGSLRAAFLEAVRHRRPVRTPPRRFEIGGSIGEVSVHIQPLPGDGGGCFLIAFERVAPLGAVPAERDGLHPEDRVAELELELSAVRAELEGTVAALRVSNEELRTSGEEVSSMNEELQTANEELIASKEELQSLNEELVTVNAQLKTKVQHLEEANDDLSNLLESTQVATVFFDPNLRVRSFTPSAGQHFQLVERDIGRPLHDVAPRFDDPELYEAAVQVLRTRQPSSKDVLGEDGRWYARRILPYRTQRREGQGILLTLSDIDLLKRAELEVRQSRDSLQERLRARDAELEVAADVQSSLEDELRKEKARLQLVLDTAEDGILSVDGSGVIESANAAAERMFGYEAGLVGTSWARLLAEAPPISMVPSAAAGRSGQPTFGLRGDGRRFPMELSMGRSALGSGGPRHTVTVRDVSERMVLEQQYRHAQKMEAIGRLTSGIAHDFNNLLMGLMGCARSVLRRLEADHPALPYAAELEHAAQRGAQITRDLLTFTRTSGPEGETVDVRSLLIDVQGILQRLVGNETTLTVDAPSTDALRATIGRGPLQQLLLNLVTNARDAVQTEGRIRVGVRRRTLDAKTALTAFELPPGRYVVLEVADDGAGMAKETLERLFEPFFTTKGVGEGTGLGLSMVYSIVERAGGGIDVHSELGHGTRFEVYLPEADAAPETPAPAVPAVVTRAPSVPTQTVLVVEDEALVRQTIADALEEGGYRVVAVGNGPEAEKAFEELGSALSLLVSDVGLPRQSGPALVAQLRARRPELRCLFMSAYSEAQLRDEGRIPEDGRSLQKPFEPDTLLRAVAAALAPDP